MSTFGSNTTDGNQSPIGKRQVAVRQGTHLDTLPFPASDTYAATSDTPTDLVATRAAAAWDRPVDVRGRDSVQLLLTFTKVAGQTSLIVAIQSSPYVSLETAEWFDRHSDFAILYGDSVALPTSPRDLTLDVSGFSDGEHRIITEIETLGHWMRFKPYGGGTLTASRCKIEALRVTNGS